MEKLMLGQKIALVVGVNNYTDLFFTTLNGAVNDASDFSGFLKYTLGFETMFLGNPTAVEASK